MNLPFRRVPVYVRAVTLKMATGRWKPFSTASPAGSAATAFSIFPYTRCVTRIWPVFASEHRRADEIADGADRAVVAAALEADRAERRVAVRDAHAESELVAALLPAADEQLPTASRISSAMRTAASSGWSSGPGR